MTPVICLIFTYFIIELSSDQLPKGNLFEDVTYPYIFGDSTIIDQNSLLVNKTTFERRPGFPSRNNPLQWYLYECVDRCNSTALGSYDGSVAQTDPDGQSLLGSIPNDKSQSMVSSVTIDYYNNPNGTDKYVPFFIPSNNANAEIFNRG